MEANSKNYLPGPLFGPYSFINIFCGKEDIDDLQCSRTNIMEVAVVIKILQNLYKAWKALKQPLSIVIASSHTSRVVEIKEKIGDKYKRFGGLFAVNVMLTQQLLEGKLDEDIVILSTVGSNFDCSDQLRVDVASIRARHCLWILGNEATLSESDYAWKSLIQEAKDQNCFHNVEEDNDLYEFVVGVKNELDQLDELLNPDSSLFRNSIWKVSFSDQFRKSFEQIGCSQMKKLVVNLLLRLANGWRPKRRNNVNITCEKSKHVLKQFKVKDRYVICSIDIVKELHSPHYVQVLRVWDVIPLIDVSALVKQLDAEFLSYTVNFLDCCKSKRVHGDLEIPFLWDTSHDIVRFKKISHIREKAFPRDLSVTETSLLMKFYSVSSGMVSHLLSGCNGRELELPFELTNQEEEIVHFDRSSFVLGRSGTGKTTVLIRKLSQREQLSHIASEGFHEPLSGCSSSGENDTEETFLRQIFVTLNPRLCYAVKEQFSGLKRCMHRFATCGKPSEDCASIQLDDLEDLSRFGEIPDSFVNLRSKSYPLSVTLHKFLMMLDGTIGSSFFDRFPQARRICSHGNANARAAKSMALKTFIRMNEVTFKKFDLSYWPHFSKESTKSLEASIVFTEIMSHIKGGIKKILDREDYIYNCRTRASSFGSKEKEKIYDMFLQYEKLKTDNCEYDTADLVIDLHSRLRERKYEGDLLDFVYVDEVQDLSMSQIALFKYICKNVRDGFFFVGDTAQTIAKGIDFRFKDIRCLFYKEFVMKQESDRVKGKVEKGIVTDLFHLNQNFRSHARILKLAQSVTDLLYHFFPRSIDVLDPETSHINGETPTIIQSDGKKALVSLFGNGGESGKNLVGFGAEQVILVRDDKTRNEITSFVGQHSLILTISECKGLEFQDVLLYNFLSSSPIGNQWRVIYEFIFDHKSDRTFPLFNEAKHRLLCSELKQLYVAITRTKNRLWIIEDDGKVCEPMFDYWKKLNSVEVRQLDDRFVEGFQVSSTDHQWKSRGVELFNQHKYEAARMCFNKAGEEFLKKWAEAAELRANAYHISSSNSTMAKLNLKEAARLFYSIGKFEYAAQCYYESEEYELAGEIYSGKCGNSKLEEAGECFSRSGLHDRAALAFARGNFFSSCLASCLDGKLFDDGLNYIEQWKQHSALNNNAERSERRLIRTAAQKLSVSAAVHYKKLGDRVTMMRFIESFHTRDSMRAFLKSEACLDELLRLEIKWECFRNAVSLAKQIGESLLEADILEKAKCFREASSVLFWYVFRCSLWRHGSEGWPLKHFARKKELLDRAESLAVKVSPRFFNLVCSDRKILSIETVSLDCLVNLFSASERHSSLSGGILSARRILDAHFHLCGSKFRSEDEYIVTDLGSHVKDVLLKNEVSVETLIFFWNYWKSNIVKVFKYLESLKGNEDYGEFCLNYLGARTAEESVNDKTTLFLLNSDSYWAKQINEKYLRRKGNLVICKSKQFVHAARCYWSLEMLSVGTKVLEKLEAIYELRKQDSSPLHCQLIPLLNMFEVSKSLRDSEFLHRKNDDEVKIQRYLDMSSSNFLEDLLPVDWRKRATLDMNIELTKTEKFRVLLKQTIEENFLKESPKFENFVKMSAIVAVYGWRLDKKTCQRISLRFHYSPSLKTFLESLMNIGPTLDSASRVKNLLKSFELIRVSDETSPLWFVYLLEHVLISTFCLKHCFFSTSSSFVEWLVGKDQNNKASCDFVSDWEIQFSGALDTTATIISRLLYSELTIVAIEWRQLFVLRLILVLCLLCINTGKYYTLLSELLGEEDIVSWLQPEFTNFVMKLRLRSTSDTITNARALAEAFKEIDNPLVIAFSGTCFVESDQIADAIYIDLEDLK